jgi:predicted CopG family antitoxin
MKPRPPANQSRAGKRAPGQTTATISLSADTLARARQLAAAEDRSLSNWLRRLIERNINAVETLAETTSTDPLPERQAVTYQAGKPTPKPKTK